MKYTKDLKTKDKNKQIIDDYKYETVKIEDLNKI